MSEPTPSSVPLNPDDDTINLVDLLLVLSEEKKHLFGITIVGSLLSVAVSFTVPRYYETTTVILPPQQSQSAAAGALAQLGALAGVAGIAGMKQNDELYAALMRSRTIQDAVISEHDLGKVYETESLEKTRKELGSNVLIVVDKKSGLISVTVTDRSAELAAKIANSYPRLLKERLDVLAVTDAQQRRRYFESENTKAQKRLADAELNFRAVKARNGILPTEILAESAIRASVEMRALISAKEVQLSALKTFSTEKNPEVQRLSSEVLSLREQLRRIEEGITEGKADNQGMDSVIALREVKVRAAAVEALTRQLELARLDESREAPLLQQVDVALAPERPTKPRRLMIMIVGAILSSIMAIAFVMLKRRETLRRFF